MNSLNLKKKIAFISSLAMLAATAAYLPADIAKQVGFGSSIVSAAGAFENEGDLDTMSLYVTIDGKYYDKTKDKTYSTLKEAEDAGADDLLQIADTDLTDSVDSNAFVDKFTVNTSTVKIPYGLAKPGSKIAVAAVAVEGAALKEDSVTSIEVVLDDKGMAKIPNQDGKFIKGQSDDSNYDESAANPVGSKGGYETVDLSGYVFEIDDFGGASGITLTNGKITKINGTDPSQSVSKTLAFVSSNAAIDKKDAVTADYKYKKIGDIYANVLKVDAEENIKPGSMITLSSGVNTNWTISGVGVDNKDINVTMGDDGYAESGLITVTKGDVSEYYVIVVKNKADIWDADATASGDIAITGGAANSATLTPNGSAAVTDSYKVVKSKVAENVTDGSGNTSKEFVEVFTVYNNDITKGITSANQQKITLTATSGTLDIPSITAAATGAGDTWYLTKDSGTGTVLKSAVQTAEESCAGKDLKTAELSTSTAGNYETPVIKYTNGGNSGYFKVVFTTEYEIELDDKNSKTEEDGTTAVNAQTVTKPAAPSKNGFTFEGWYLAQLGGTELDSTKPVYTVAGKDLQQTKAGEVTPNQKLIAKYRGNEYVIRYDANGGKLTGSQLGTMTTISSGANAEKYIVTSAATAADGGSDLTNAKTAANIAGDRYGYDFKGWALTPDATEPIKASDMEVIRPEIENDEVTLYAVYEGKEIKASFKTIAFDTQTGLNKTTNGDVAAVKSNYTNSDAAFANTLDGVKMVTTGKKLGTLPTPVKKGYTFDAWYIKYVDADTNTITAKRVSSSTVLSEAVFNRKVTTTVGDLEATPALTLYAKFKQNTYNVTVDLDGGHYAEDDYLEPVSYKYIDSTLKAYNKNGAEVKASDDAGNSIAENQPVKGNGDFYQFEGWTINGGKAVVSSANLLTQIKNLAEAGDVTIKAQYKLVSNAEVGSIYFDKNGGDFYTCPVSKLNADGTPKTLAKGSNPNVSGTAGEKVSSTWTIADNTLKDSSDYYVAARAGYTFTGWFTDKECTKAYTFGNFPNKEEITLYAGWKANTTTRYAIKYNLVDADGSIIASSSVTGNQNPNKGSDGYNFLKEFMGTTGTTVNAADREITLDGKKYVFDTKLSSGLKSSAELTTAFVPGSDMKLNGSAVESTPDGVIDSFDTDGLAFGHFILCNSSDKTNYTVLEATYIEESAASTELGTVDDVKVDAEGKVTWSAVDNAVKYKVVKKVNGKAYYGDETTATSYQFGSVPTTEYSVRVVAFDKDGNKTWGKEITIAPAASDVLGKVKNIKVAADRKSVTWDAADNAVSYKVVKKIGDKTYYTSEITDTSYTFGSATQGEFSVKVVAFDAYGEKTWSDEYKVAAAPVASLGSVGNVKVGTDNKTLTWSAVDNAVSYRVAKIVGGKTYYTAKTTKLTTTLGSALKEGNKVYLIAYDKNGKSVTGPQTKISSVAKATKVAVAADGKTVTWTAAKNAAKYQVAKLINGKTYYGTKVDAKTTKYTFGSAATAGTQVFVITFDADGNSSYSDAVLVK